nr:DUF3244 domain-containing protein [uncultured Bacteroides sp.]
MKTQISTLIFILCLQFGSCFSLCAKSYNNESEIKLESYPIKTKDSTGGTNKEEVPIKRSIQIQPIFAYLHNKVISIDFVETFTVANITVTNETTGETVFLEMSNNPVNLNINLNDKTTGSYLIEIEADDICLHGYFNL